MCESYRLISDDVQLFCKSIIRDHCKKYCFKECLRHSLYKAKIIAMT